MNKPQHNLFTISVPIIYEKIRLSTDPVPLRYNVTEPVGPQCFSDFPPFPCLPENHIFFRFVPLYGTYFGLFDRYKYRTFPPKKFSFFNISSSPTNITGFLLHFLTSFYIFAVETEKTCRDESLHVSNESVFTADRRSHGAWGRWRRW